jgi:hypothetical protein
MTPDLPELPKPEYSGVQVPTAACAGAVQYQPPIRYEFKAVSLGPTYTAEQMQAYGRECYEAGLRAAKESR